MVQFSVTHINFGTFRQFETFEQAKAWAIAQCFEATVTLIPSGTLVATFHPISGFRKEPAYW